MALSIVKKRSLGLQEVDLSLIERDVIASEQNLPMNDALQHISQICSDKSCIDPEWGLLAGRLLMENIHLMAPKSFSEATEKMKSILHPEYYDFVIRNRNYLDSIIHHSSDFNFDYFSVCTLMKSYLCQMSINNQRVLIETPQYMYLRVATYLHYPNLTEIGKVYSNLKNGNYSHATPTLFNAGMKRPSLSSCYLQHIEDDTVQIGEAIKQQMIISKNAGGLGINWSSIRHSEIGGQGMSDGIIPWIKITDRTLKAVTQGGKRKGSGAMYLRDLHVDIFEFVELQDDGPEELRTRDLFLAIMVSDLFMERVKEDGVWSLFCPNKVPGLFEKWGLDFEMAYKIAEGEKRYSRQARARELWHHILNMQIKRGMPFILYMDACNRKSNQKNSGLIRTSNLCVSGDTKILTNVGYQKIGGLEGKEVTIWNGEEWSEVKVQKTGVGKDLIRVNLSNGAYLDCTPEHKFYLGDHKEIQAVDLKNGDKLLNWKVPVIESTRMANLDAIGRYLGGENIDEKSMYIRSTDRDHLLDIRQTLNTLGIDTNLVRSRDLWYLVLPFYDISYIFKENVHSLINPKRYKRSLDVTVENVEEGPQGVDTFCFTEPKRHMGVFNGILTGQCTEILEVSNKDEIASCNLASVCLPKCVDYDEQDKPYFNFERLATYTAEIVRNLNNAIDRTYYPVEVPQIKRSNDLHRPLGIGVQGLADTFALLDIAWVNEDATDSSVETKELNHKIFECMYYSAIKESIELAKKYGSYPTFSGSPASKGLFQFDLWDQEKMESQLKQSLEYESVVDGSEVKMDQCHLLYSGEQWDQLRKEMVKYGLRNSLLLALMPTASSAHILGNIESFEPLTQAIFARTVLSGQFMVVNKHIVRDLKAIGMWNTQTVRRIVQDRGSIQGLEGDAITENRLVYLKRKYLTVYEISQKILVDLAIQRGKYICQTQSFSCHMRDPNKAKLTAYHFYSWSQGAKTGIYYLRQELKTTEINTSLNNINIPERKVEKEECLMCQS